MTGTVEFYYKQLHILTALLLGYFCIYGVSVILNQGKFINYTFCLISFFADICGVIVKKDRKQENKIATSGVKTMSFSSILEISREQ